MTVRKRTGWQSTSTTNGIGSIWVSSIQYDEAVGWQSPVLPAFRSFLARVHGMRPSKGYTLAELLVIVLIIGVLTSVTIPRLQFGTRDVKQAEVEARKIITDLRRTRSLAILYAATHPAGFALEIRHKGKTTSYEIRDLDNSKVVDSQTLATRVSCTGTSRFVFGPLGALMDSADASLVVSASEATFEIAVVPSTGAVRCVKK